MKNRNLLHLVFILIAGQLLFACNSVKYYEFAASKQAPYKVTKQKSAPEATTEEPATISEVALAAASEEEKELKNGPVLEASTAPAVTSPAKAPKAIAEAVTAPEATITEVEALALAKEHVKNMTKAEKKELKRELKEVMRQSGSRTSIVEIILAVLVPPLAVFLHDGIGSSFWISLLLWFLFVIPGIIYALLVVTDTI